MHVVIVGAGSLGRWLARSLVSAGHEVAVIEEDRGKGADLDEALGSLSVIGSGTDEAVMAKAGVNRSDAVIATTGRDDVNLAVCQLAHHRFGVGRTLSIVNESEHTELFELLGVDVPIDKTELIASRLQESVSSDGLVRLLPLSRGDGKTVATIRIPQGSVAAGRTLRDAGLPPSTVASAVVSRDGTTTPARDDTVLQPGDEVVAVTVAEEVENLKERLIVQAGA